jgi:Type IV secretory pathway, VirB3-like protein
VDELFPEEVEVQYGLVNLRAICGVPVGLCMTLLLVGIAPLLFWGKSKWWITALCLGLGVVLAVVVKDDPQCFSAWAGEYGLKDYYD